MKVIPYKKKSTSANTEYWETRKSDTKWMLDQCQRISDLISNCEKGPADLRSIADELSKDSILMPRMSTGKRNSTKTMIDGILTNFKSGQYNLSNKTAKGMQEAFRQVAAIFETFEEVSFEEVEVLPKLVPNVPKNESLSTLGTLFDIDSITVTFKPKK